jgi:cell division septation protein DedD
VPIRPDEGAPTRAQAQPRVVPANPRPAATAAAPEPEDANAPLRITPQAGRPPQRAATAVQPGTVPSSSSAPQTTQSTPAPATGGSGFTVQLAAEGSEDAARAKFNRMRGQYSETLGSQNPNIRSAEVNGRSVYRVRVGNMSREEAVSLCEKLKSDGGSCFVARN